MKKFTITFLILLMLSLSLPLVTNAQTCKPRRYRSAAVQRSYYNNSSNYRRPSYFQRHRNVKNIALATGGGALLGGLIGGSRKGMGIGALVGAGGGALYTYVLNPRKKRAY
ncbi:MAG TPA: hypothetical protein PKY82_33645 [Pyrinomonadaceae bacterium]|nr:hypothetical protein [Pyrinomonadaceae bacterium]